MLPPVFVFRMTFIGVMSLWWPLGQTDHLGVMWHARPGSLCHQQLVSPALIHFINSFMFYLNRAEHQCHIAKVANTTRICVVSHPKLAPFPRQDLLSFTQNGRRTGHASTGITQEKKAYIQSKPSLKIVHSREGRLLRQPGISEGRGFVLKSTDWWNTLAAFISFFPWHILTTMKKIKWDG